MKNIISLRGVILIEHQILMTTQHTKKCIVLVRRMDVSILGMKVLKLLQFSSVVLSEDGGRRCARMND